MKILLTGKPRSGKTTILESFINEIEDKQGFIAREMKENNERVGFELIATDNSRATLANVNSISGVRVSRYGVEVDELNKFIANLPPVQRDYLLYVDEVGQMELYSDMFKELVTRYLESENIYIGTISSVYQSDFINRILQRPDVLLLTIDPENRSFLSEILLCLAGNFKHLNKLSLPVRHEVTKMAQQYIKTSEYTQLKKLFKNTIKYLSEGRVSIKGDDMFVVSGDTDEHSVKKTKSGWECDCDLFLGKGIYANHPGECSHIQSAKILQLTKNS